MGGGTTFHLIIEGFDVAFERAEATADSLASRQTQKRLQHPRGPTRVHLGTIA
jgi:hypothetical protein